MKKKFDGGKNICNMYLFIIKTHKLYGIMH